MKKLLRVIVCAAALLGIGTVGMAADFSVSSTAEAEDTAYNMTEQLYARRKDGENLVFSPYSVQQIFPLIRDNTSSRTVRQEILPYIVPGIQREKLKNTKTGGMVLLDKALAPEYTGQGNDKVRLVSYPGEALKAKENFQKEILGSVIDDVAPTGNLSFFTAAHYYAEWAEKFDKKLTKERPFTNEKGQIVDVMTMKKHFSDGTGKTTPEYDMAALWGKKGSVVYFIKPKQDAREIAKNLATIVSDFEKGTGRVRNVDLEMPKLSLKNKIDLNELLQSMGLDSFYNGKLYFDRLTGMVPYVLDSASQTATLDVNEDYAEGKALTEISFRATAMMEPPVVHYIKMDSPYFIVIKDRTDKGVARVVFTAWVADPSVK